MYLSKFKVNKDPKAVLSIFLQLSLLLVSVSYAFLYPPTAQAKLSTSYVRFDRQSNGAQLGGVVCVADDGSAPNGQSQGINKVIVGFPSTFVLNSSTWTVDTTAANLPTGVTAWPTVTGPSVVDTSTKAAIFSVGDITSGVTYCFHFSTTGTNNVGTGGNDQAGQVWAQKVTTGTTTSIINFPYAASIISTAAGDQIGVTASVSGTFTFTLSGTQSQGLALPLGVLSTTAVTAPYTITASVTTNAQRGYLSWIKSANAGLTSAQASGTPVSSVSNAASVALTGGNNGYGIYAYSAAATIAAPYDGGVTTTGTLSGTGVGQVHSTQFDQLASASTSVSGQQFQIGTRARLAGTEKPATDYTDTITVVAAGSF
jgi:hypothetical protein